MLNIFLLILAGTRGKFINYLLLIFLSCGSVITNGQTLSVHAGSNFTFLTCENDDKIKFKPGIYLGAEIEQIIINNLEVFFSTSLSNENILGRSAAHNYWFKVKQDYWVNAVGVGWQIPDRWKLKVGIQGGYLMKTRVEYSKSYDSGGSMNFNSMEDRFTNLNWAPFIAIEKALHERFLVNIKYAHGISDVTLFELDNNILVGVNQPVDYLKYSRTFLVSLGYRIIQ